jgi:N6-L-threonylcarbamoyladenine synthase
MMRMITEVPVYFPAMEYCGDNAAMIAAAGYFKYQKTKTSNGLTINGNSRLTLQ